jgi:hypothetical protein
MEEVELALELHTADRTTFSIWFARWVCILKRRGERQHMGFFSLCFGDIHRRRAFLVFWSKIKEVMEKRGGKARGGYIYPLRPSKVPKYSLLVMERTLSSHRMAKIVLLCGTQGWWTHIWNSHGFVTRPWTACADAQWILGHRSQVFLHISLMCGFELLRSLHMAAVYSSPPT